jgi:DNA-binding Lrp family transcriptional regulator
MHIDGLDELDNKILDILEQNARLSYSDIGVQVGHSRVSVKNRMDILEKKGIIQGYKAIINPTGAPEGRRFFMDVITEPDKFEEVVDNIAKYEIIRRVYALTGESRFKAEGFASSNMKYEMFMRSVKRHSEGIRSISIQDAQYTIKDIDGGVDYVRLDERDGADAPDE